jgi:hypothetical protein
MIPFLMLSAFASPPADAVDALVGRLSDGDPPEQLCAEPFLGREVRGCKPLVKLVVENGIEPARRAVSEDEALVELWLGKGADRWPITLLAKPTPDGWRFVDATDADGPELKTRLSLAGQDDASPTAVEAGVAAFLEKLHDPKLAPEKVCADAVKKKACTEAVAQARGKGLRFRPTRQLIRGDALWVMAIVEREGKAVDEVRLGFTKAGKRWGFASIDEEPIPR